MPNIPINVTGASYKSRSLPLSAQTTKNFYPELVDNHSAKSPLVLHSFPGLKLFGTAFGEDRGMHEFNSQLYKVTGTTLYSVDSLGVHTSIGEIGGNSRCRFDVIGSVLVIVSGGKVWSYNLTTLAEITDVDLESPNSATHLNNQIIYDGAGGRFAVSDVGDATSIDALNYATAESNADDLLMPYVFNQILYLFGDKTIEPWYNSGVGSPPFDRIEGGMIPVGLGSIDSVSNNDDYIYFLGDDSKVYTLTGSTEDSVSSIALSHSIESYNVVSDAIGFCFTMEGQEFYMLTFPSEDRTWCFSQSTKFWFELGTTGRHYANDHVFIYRKNLVSDYKNGNIYELDLDTFTDNGDEIQRIRDTGPIHSGLIGEPGKTVEMSRFELIMETGTGTAAGQGVDPVVMLSMSDDGGKTWSTEMWGSIGTMGNFIYKVEWFALGSFFKRIIRIRISDPVHCSIHSASSDMEVGI